MRESVCVCVCESEGVCVRERGKERESGGTSGNTQVAPRGGGTSGDTRTLFSSEVSLAHDLHVCHERPSAAQAPEVMSPSFPKGSRPRRHGRVLVSALSRRSSRCFELPP
jgi:hypothetical protein